MVLLRNVNLRSMVTPRQDIGYHVHCMTTLGRRFLETEDGEDSVARPLQHMYLQVQKQVLNAANS